MFKGGEMSSAKLRLNEFFVEWLLVDSDPTIIQYLHEDASFSSDSPEKVSLILDAMIDRNSHSQPPRSPASAGRPSPKKRSQSDMLSFGGTFKSHNQLGGSPIKESDSQAQVLTRRRSNIDAIPTFFAAIGVDSAASMKSQYRIPEDSLVNKQAEIELLFKPFPGGIGVESFVHITKNLCGFPSFFNKALFQRIMEYYVDDPSSKMGLPRKIPTTVAVGAKLKLKAFINFWQIEIEPYDNFGRFFRLVKNPNSDFIRKDDFVPFILELLLLHPGLDFLASHEEFKRKYALTVIARIFYKVNLSRTGKITCREVRRSNIVQEFMHVDEETDINRCVEYFSYEHFYVLYCRFFELDADKDAKISVEDLVKYGDYCLSETIIDRFQNRLYYSHLLFRIK